MNRKSFLSLLSAAAGALLCGFRKPKDQFFWVDEETEVFVAPSLEALNEELGRGLEGPWYGELLTEQNRGETWDFADAEMRIWEEGERGGRGLARTAQEWVKEFEGCAWFRKNRFAQLSTQYN